MKKQITLTSEQYCLLVNALREHTDSIKNKGIYPPNLTAEILPIANQLQNLLKQLATPHPLERQHKFCPNCQKQVKIIPVQITLTKVGDGCPKCFTPIK